MRRGFLYLVAIMDWFSRKVLAWRLSNTMDADFCVAALEEAIACHGRPDIFNADQGSQFTSFAFTTTLKEAGSRGNSVPARATSSRPTGFPIPEDRCRLRSACPAAGAAEQATDPLEVYCFAAG
jgi:hypothetical protein